MADNYVAMIVAVLVWLGLFWYIWRVDKRVRDWERR